MSGDKEIIYGNGVLAESGRRSVEVSADDLYATIEAEFEGRSAQASVLTESLIHGLETKRTLGPPPEFDVDDLAQVRWGIIWPPKPLSVAEEAHRAALGPLLTLRQEQMGGRRPNEFYYQPGWEYDDFLWNTAEVETGEMRPDSVPYYICIVGSPSRIPWEFQQYLDGEYAVGRLWFDDPADCESYVEHLIRYERSDKPSSLGREALLVGTQHADDPPTRNSAARLVRPLFDWLVQERDEYNFQPTLLLGDAAGGGAYKAEILKRLGGSGTDRGGRRLPSLLFTAGHGMEYHKDSSDQASAQGALLFQDWPGPFTKPQPAHYLSGGDLQDEINLEGMITFCFACFSAGTPLKDDWVYPSFWQRPQQIAQQPFVARLPQKMLAQGLGAFVGHVSRAWESSFMAARDGQSQTETFRAVIGELLRGRRTGHATDYLNQRWQRQTVQLENWMSNKKRKRGKKEVIALWQARNDGRGYVVLGDPATKMRVDLLQ